MVFGRRTAVLALLLTAAAAPAATTAAAPCALDRPPAATLLLPYFEVDLDGSATTLLAFGNARREATLTRVTLWSDMGVPVLAYDVYLTGWDVETINLRDVLAGSLSPTATPLADPGDHISRQGDFSEEADFPGCEEALPPPPLGAAFAAHVRAALSGMPSGLTGRCSGFPHGDGHARGYVTVDVVEACGAPPPGAEGAGETAALGAANVLWGDYLLVDPVENRASGAALLRLEADAELFAGEPRTFYAARGAGDGADAREPLPSIWATRFLAHAGTDTHTDFLYWRDPGVPSADFECGSLDFGEHPWYVDAVGSIVIFDEEENALAPLTCPILCPAPLPNGPFTLHAGRVAAGSEGFPVHFDFGWIYADVQAPSWLGSLMGAEERFSAISDATPLDEPCAPGVPVNGSP